MWKIIKSIDNRFSLCECGECHCQYRRQTKAIKYAINHNPDAVCKSCANAKTGAKLRKHGGWAEKSITYNSWRCMRDRCNQPSSPNYKLYGGRGIRVCDRWMAPVIGYENFIADMGERPSKEYTLDRIDPSSDYCPENCRWADKKTQSRGSVKYIEFGGKKMSEREWSLQLFGRETIVSQRLTKGWSTKKALTTPLKRVRRNITYKGEVMSAQQWSKRLGINAATIIYRLNHGMTDGEALTTPIDIKKRNKRSIQPR